MKNLSVLILSVFLVTSVGAMPPKLETIKIKTSSQCDMCKERIEEALAFEKGVKSSELDIGTKIVTVSYKAGKTSPEKIRQAISKAGYDADDIAADTKKYEKLPACCKKPDDPEHEGH
jgi:periplasmic mercuric ion binding protein